MKNAVVKHHKIENNTELSDGSYCIQYTTCPEKSYLVKPEEGEINYDEYK